MNDWICQSVFRSFAVAILLVGSLAVYAAPSDCEGTALDGKAVCVLPTYAPATFSSCDITGPYIFRQNAWAACYSELGIAQPVTSEASIFAVTDCFDKKLVSTGGLTGSIPWAPTGASHSDNFCALSVRARDVNGHQVQGWATLAGASSNFLFARSEVPSCQTGYTAVSKLINGVSELYRCRLNTPCAADSEWNAGLNSCVLVVDNFQQSKTPSAQTCSAAPGKPPLIGNPINPFSGEKSQAEDTGSRIGGLPLVFTYRSSRVAVNSGFGSSPSVGKLWMSSLHRNLNISTGAGSIKVHRGNGVVLSFTLKSGAYVADANVHDSLVAISGGYLFRSEDEKQLESYNAQGQLTTITRLAGPILKFRYSDAPSVNFPEAGYLMDITDDSYRRMSFTYSLPDGGNPILDGLLASVNTTSGAVLTLSYNSDRNLSAIGWSGGATKQYLYENPVFPWALTGVVDENSGRYATFAYDSAGSAISTEHANGVEKYATSFGSAPQVNVVEVLDSVAKIKYRNYTSDVPPNPVYVGPDGSPISISGLTVLGTGLVTGYSQPPGSGCAEATTSSTLDVNGNVASKTNFSGEKTCYAYDGVNRETWRIEGLPVSADCGPLFNSTTLPSATARTILTKWHPDWRMPAKVSSPGKQLTSVFNGLGDPFNPENTISCAPTAPLPDGKPRPLVCQSVLQEVTPQQLIDATDPSFSAVSLLLHGDGPEGSTSFVDSSTAPKVISTAMGAPKMTAAQRKFGSSSLYFNGSSAIGVSGLGGTTFWTSDWTVEAWILNAVAAASPAAIFGNRHPDGGAQLYAVYSGNVLSAISFEIRENGALTGFGVGTGTPGFTTAVSADGSFNHVAVTKVGKVYTFFVNGVMLPAITRAVQPNNTPTVSTIYVGGANPYWYNYGFNGYIDDFRLTIGTPRYTSTFTPAVTALPDGNPVFPVTASTDTNSFTYDSNGRILTSVDTLGRQVSFGYYGSSSFASDSAGDPFFNSVALLLHGDGVNGSSSFIDSSSTPTTIAINSGAPIVSQAKSQFGSSSIYFNGSSSIKIADANGSEFWKSDWTAEFAALSGVDTQSTAAVFGNRYGDGGGQLYLSYSGGLLTAITYEVRENGATVGFGVSTGTTGFASARAGAGEFNAIALVKEGLTYSFFLNGVSLGSVVRTMHPDTPIAYPNIVVGAATASDWYPYYFNGYIDEFRITMGVQRYFATYGLRVSAFPNDGANVISLQDDTGHTVGDLQSITNPAGQVTTFNLYDRAGRVRQSTDPKGIVTDTTYTPRGWVSSVSTTAPGQTARLTTYTYDAVGQLTGVLSPDGTSTTMSYDAAHRLIGASDAKGNSVAYTLDNMGNRIGEQIKDPSGVLQLQMQRSFDALNRVQQVKVGAP